MISLQGMADKGSEPHNKSEPSMTYNQYYNLGKTIIIENNHRTIEKFAWLPFQKHTLSQKCPISGIHTGAFFGAVQLKNWNFSIF